MCKTSQINSTTSVSEMRRDPQLKKWNRVTSREFLDLLAGQARGQENQEAAAQPQLYKLFRKKTLQKRKKMIKPLQSLSKLSPSQTRAKPISKSPEGSELPKNFSMSASDRQSKPTMRKMKMSSIIIKVVLSLMILK